MRPVVLGLLEHSREPLVVLDLTGVELVNSSFSDEVLALPLQRLCGGEYGERFLAVLSPTAEIIQDAQLPLEKRDLTVMVFVGDTVANSGIFSGLRSLISMSRSGKSCVRVRWQPGTWRRHWTSRCRTAATASPSSANGVL